MKMCPFCGTTAKQYLIIERTWENYWVECDYCGARGPLVHSVESAKEGWEDRATKERKLEAWEGGANE